MADNLLHPLRGLKGAGGGHVDYGPIIGPRQILIGLASIIVWVIMLSIINKISKSMEDAKKDAQQARATAYVNSMLHSSKGMAAGRAAMVQRAMPEAAAAYEAANAAAILAGLAPPREARIVRIDEDQAEEDRIKLMTAQQQQERSDGPLPSSQPAWFEAFCAACGLVAWLGRCYACCSCLGRCFACIGQCFACICGCLTCSCCSGPRQRRPDSMPPMPLDGDEEAQATPMQRQGSALLTYEEVQPQPMPEGSSLLASRVESQPTPNDASAAADPPAAKQRARLPKRQPVEAKATPNQTPRSARAQTAKVTPRAATDRPRAATPKLMVGNIAAIEQQKYLDEADGPMAA